jgi:hypothetical protein
VVAREDGVLDPCGVRPVVVVLLALVACRSTEPPVTGEPSKPAARAVDPGPWTLMRFLGGPPAGGQITDTTVLDPSAGRRVHIERNRAGDPHDRSCDAEAREDAAWADLVAALGDPDLTRALAHESRMPLLVIDAGYFACTHAGSKIAVSDMQGGDSSAPRETAALRRLSSAYQRLHDEVVALPACGSL